MNQSLKEEIVEKLKEKKALNPCQRCGNPGHTLLDGFVNLPLSTEVSGNVIIGGPQVPCAVVACNNCGNLSYHALGALGMLNDKKDRS